MHKQMVDDWQTPCNIYMDEFRQLGDNQSFLGILGILS